jgi:Serine dehydratase beta chain
MHADRARSRVSGAYRIGPSGSHTVGPMHAAGDFVAELNREGLLENGTDRAILAFGLGRILREERVLQKRVFIETVAR